ncbi:uncharacterized protein VP01_2640g1 [Puccinia sorghi]|uniref:DDE-1 domain-containing protein n=1 Tax=Puccinia sorghi TaxID=27349 RepID=A0A0L6V4C8_9BASI|nr:uncharacterized protein VP01_2640g1 [Puccinia sorghi]
MTYDIVSQHSPYSFLHSTPPTPIRPSHIKRQAAWRDQVAHLNPPRLPSRSSPNRKPEPEPERASMSVSISASPKRNSNPNNNTTPTNTTNPPFINTPKTPTPTPNPNHLTQQYQSQQNSLNQQQQHHQQPQPQPPPPPPPQQQQQQHHHHHHHHHHHLETEHQQLFHQHQQQQKQIKQEQLSSHHLSPVNNNNNQSPVISLNLNQNNSFPSSQSIQNLSPATQPLLLTLSSSQPPSSSNPTNQANNPTTTATATNSSAGNQNASTSAERGSNGANCNNTCQVKRKFNATLEQKIFILDWHHANGKKQTKTAAYFTSLDGWPTITQPLISNWLKDEEKIRANLKLATPDTKRLRILGCDLIKIKALEFAIGFGLDQAEFTKSSTCWIDRFLDRQSFQFYSQGTRSIKTHKVENFNQVGIEAERQRIKSAIAYYAPQDVWTLDETSLYYTMPPDRSVPIDRWRTDQRLLTFGLCINSDGSQRRAPWIIGKNWSQKAFKIKSTDSLGFDYSANPKASLTAEVFIKWMSTWQKELNKHNRKILLIIDNNPGHIVEADLYPNIRVEFISSNISSFLQPLDQGIFRLWKAHYRRLTYHTISLTLRSIISFLERTIGLYEAKSTNIYQIDQLQAMQLATSAWTNFVPADKIVSCWRHALLTPDSSPGFNTFVAAPPREKVVGQAESDLSKVIDTFVELSLLNTNNRISIEEYTDPPFERVVTLQKYTDPEIISLVRNEDASRDEDEVIEEQKDEKPSIPVPANLAPVNGHARSQVAQTRTSQHMNHPQNLMEGPHHQVFSHHLQPFQHPSHPNLLLHPSHTMHPHNSAHLSAGTLSYIPNNQIGLQKTNDEPIQRKGEIWSVPQVLEALEEIGRFSMQRREPEWKEVPHMLARMARALKNEVGNPTSTTAGASTGPGGGSPFNVYPHLQSPLLSASRVVHSQAMGHPTPSQAHPMATSYPLPNAHSPPQNSLSHHPSASASPHPHQHPHPHSHPHPHQSNPRPQSQPLAHSQSHPPSHAQSSQPQLLHSHSSAQNQAQAQHLSQLHQQTLTPGPQPNQGLTTPRPQSAHSPCRTTTQPTNSSSSLTAPPAPHSTPSRQDHHLTSSTLASSLAPSQSNNNPPPPHPHSQLSIDAITHPVDVNSN